MTNPITPQPQIAPQSAVTTDASEARHPTDLRVRQLHYKPESHRLERAVGWWCIIIATVTFWYFVGREIWAVLS